MIRPYVEGTESYNATREKVKPLNSHDDFRRPFCSAGFRIVTAGFFSYIVFEGRSI
jgi:hypothetical protein